MKEYNRVRADSSVQLLVKQAFSDSICIVTVDEETGKNRIFWNKTQQEGTQSYRVLRGLEHTEVGTKVFGDDNYLIDTEVDPSIMAYRYFLETTDICGNSIISEISHKTIHLTANKGTSGEVNLIWQPYEGLDFFQYNIYRSTDSVNFVLIGGMEYDPSISQYTDYDPPAGDLYYQIGIEGDFACNTGRTKKSTNGSFVEILSNIKSLKTTGTENNFSNYYALKVYPNPVTESLTIEYPDNDGNSSLRILNILGEIVYEINMDSDKLRLELNSNFSSGLYLIQLVDETGVMKGNRMIWKE
ncbi:MAG: T9SS type A sorting domain-containing protein [bacterium]